MLFLLKTALLEGVVTFEDCAVMQMQLAHIMRRWISSATNVNVMGYQCFSHQEVICRSSRQGGGGGCQGTISTGIISEGENFATPRTQEACCYFVVGSGWFLLFPGGHFQNPGQHGIPMHSSYTTTACWKQTHL